MIAFFTQVKYTTKKIQIYFFYTGRFFWNFPVEIDIL